MNLIPAPSYHHELDVLVDSIVREAEGTGTEIIQIYLADSEEEKKQVLERVNFFEGARLRNNLKLDGGDTCDPLIYARELAGSRAGMKGPRQYYGGSPPPQSGAH